MKKEKNQKRPPIGEELKIARDQKWDPQLDASKRMPILDIAMPIDSKPRKNPPPKTLSEIMAAVEEMRRIYGDCPAVDVFERALFREAGMVRGKKLDELED